MGNIFSNIGKNAGATHAAHTRAGLEKFGEDLKHVATQLRDSHHTVHGLDTVGAQFGQHLARAAQAFQDMRLSTTGLDTAGRDLGREFGRHLVDAADLLTKHGITIFGLDAVGRELGESFGQRLLDVAKVIKDVKLNIQGFETLGVAEFGQSVDRALSHVRDMQMHVDIGPYAFRAMLHGYDVVIYAVQVALLIVILIGWQLVRHDEFWPGILTAVGGLASLAYTTVWKPRALPSLSRRLNSAKPVTVTDHPQDSVGATKPLMAPNETAHPSVQEGQLCLAHSNSARTGPQPKYFIDFELPCPGHRYGTCTALDRAWFCGICRSRLQYGYDDKLYCPCGSATAKTYRFRCNDPVHGSTSLPVDPFELNRKLQTYKPPKEINLLILGETGVGKSTWINGFINYLTFDSFAIAEQEGLICLIPSSFTMSDENYQPKQISMRYNPGGTQVEQKASSVPSSTENADDATQSATQDPKTYVFPYKDRIVRLIDTPGIGDTRGLDQDRKNFEKILAHISHVSEIHGICILLKPNNARLNLMFQFCVQELLIHLHKDACRNMVFVFTNSRSTLYRPGDSLPPLTKLLEQSRNINIPLNKTTMFCMDNESVRFLAALQAGIQFSDTERENYAKSWEKSVEETGRLMEHISRLDAHQTHATITLNEARRLILELTKPMAQITTIHKVNIGKMADKQAELAECIKRKDVLMGDLYVTKSQLELEEIPYPRTVCIAQSCIEMCQDATGQKRANYKTWCHPHCYLKDVPADTANLEALRKCQAMNDQGKCNHCGCGYENHMHVKYECRVVTVRVIDQSIEGLLDQKNGHILAAEEVIRQSKAEEADLNNELDIITSIASKFAHFLKVNAMSVYNDALDEYLRQLINQEKQKVAAGGDRETLDACEEMLQRYTHERNVLEQAIKSTNASAPEFTITSVQEDVERLHALRISGPLFRKMEWMEQQADRQRFTYMETAYRPRKVDRIRYVPLVREPPPSPPPNMWQRVWDRRPWKKHPRM
ncbi:uncharacterized protein LOC129594520 [Paramacrobiotus metropolitanus]|uniref:uncharacterized protein LOC129594520 n=1 Tax=Paramacrobiotus metropolitanus TaxID=2943436 RepID=UPI0024463947|nr:uncharacterized protein LOC129594520 [Paramacrobiotus metropolitanus]